MIKRNWRPETGASNPVWPADTAAWSPELMFRKAAGLPQPKPWLDASDVVDCDAKLLRVQVVLTP
jgi:hypothetical protein